MVGPKDFAQLKMRSVRECQDFFKENSFIKWKFQVDIFSKDLLVVFSKVILIVSYLKFSKGKFQQVQNKPGQ